MEWEQVWAISLKNTEGQVMVDLATTNCQVLGADNPFTAGGPQIKNPRLCPAWVGITARTATPFTPKRKNIRSRRYGFCFRNDSNKIYATLICCFFMFIFFSLSFLVKS